MEFNKTDKLEFKQIVLGHLKKILEISSKELKNYQTEVIHSNFTEIKSSEDTRISYIQSISNLSYILLPHFDPKMNEVHKECIEILDSIGIEVFNKLKEDYDKTCKLTGNKVDPKDFIITARLHYAKKLFRELNMLLKRVDYLRTSIYADNDDNDDDEGDDIK